MFRLHEFVPFLSSDMEADVRSAEEPAHREGSAQSCECGTGLLPCQQPRELGAHIPWLTNFRVSNFPVAMTAPIRWGAGAGTGKKLSSESEERSLSAAGGGNPGGIVGSGSQLSIGGE